MGENAFTLLAGFRGVNCPRETARRTCMKLGEHEALGLLLFVILLFCLGAKQLGALRETQTVKNSERGEESGVFCRSRPLCMRYSWHFIS